MKKLFLSLIFIAPLINGIAQLPFGGQHEVFHFIKNNHWLPENPVIVDAGAYDGTESVSMATLFWPKGHIYSFEPVPDLYARLLKNIEGVTNITPSSYALSHKNGSALFYISEEPHKPNESSMSSSLLEPKEHLRYARTLFPRTITVDTITLDDWAAKNNVDHIDFLWFDLQGSELDVLKASPNILKTVKVVYTEVEFVEAYKGQSLYHELKSWLEQQGFTMVAKNFNVPFGDNGCGGVFWFGDCLFIRP